MAEVEATEGNKHYVHVKFRNICETTASIWNLAPRGNSAIHGYDMEHIGEKQQPSEYCVYQNENCPPEFTEIHQKTNRIEFPRPCFPLF